MPLTLEAPDDLNLLDHVQPVNWSHDLLAGGRGPNLWLKALPEWMAGSRWINLVNPSNGPHGTLTGMTAGYGWQSTNRPGGWGEMRFDGTNDYVSIPVSAIPSGRTQTAGSLWIRPRTIGTNSWRALDTWNGIYAAITLKGGTAAGNTDISVFLDTSGASIGQESRSNLGYMAAGVWSHVAFSWVSGSPLKIYHNGKEVTYALQNSPNGSLSTPAVFSIGLLSGFNIFGNQDVDDVMLFPRALSADEVRRLYLHTKERHNPMLNWMLSPKRYFQVSTGTPRPVVLPSTPVADDTCLLDHVQPVNWSHDLLAGGRGPKLWLKALPEWMAGSRWVNLVDPSNGPHGTLTNGPTWSGTNRQGGWGELRFDGSNDWLDLGSPAAFAFGASSSFSVSFWFRTSAAAGVSNAVMFAKYRVSGPTQTWYCALVASTNRPIFAIFDGAANPSVTGGAARNDGVWHHYVGVRDTGADVIRLYIDGALEVSATDTTTATIANTTKAHCGGLLNAGETALTATTQFLGALDDVLIFPRALSADEVRRLYEHTRQRFNPMLNWMLSPSYYVQQAQVGNRRRRFFCGAAA
jgi:hypothetical protein